MLLAKVGGIILKIPEMNTIGPKDIFVTQPFLPPMEEFMPFLKQIWENKVLTNCGPFHHQLEVALCKYLGVEHISLFTNGTIALVTALQALEIEGEVITTPYSFVATTHSILWNGIKPVFVDIDPRTLNMDPAKIEAAITPRTKAILPVHCYGHPCDADGIQKIADKHGLKVIYDAAHAFGVQDRQGSILKYGDLSVLSFHATKVFNTFEGGAIVSPTAELKIHIDQLKNFGHDGEIRVVAAGINGKMSEFNAAIGLLQLEYIDKAILRRKEIDGAYRRRIAGISGIRCLQDAGEKVANYSYFPILVGPEYPLSRDELYQRLKESGIHPRRYFYPLISEFPMYRDLPSARRESLPTAFQSAEQILCLPIYPEMDLSVVDRVSEILSPAV
jgi:dTDP-4-amino-4,6-dideoxygalactose transaminase